MTADPDDGGADARPADAPAVAAAADLLDELVRRGRTVATAESLTGGLVGASLASVPGASQGYAGGVIAYATEVKRTVLGVPTDVLETQGAVSAACALAMAAGVRELLATDVGIATTGVAGPEPQEGKPVGLVHIGAVSGDRVLVRELRLGGSRQEIRGTAAAEALRLAARLLREAPREVEPQE